MSYYEIIIACVAMTNLMLTLLSLRASHTKAATARLDAMETRLHGRLTAHDEELAVLTAAVKAAVSQDHLAKMYRDINTLSAQVHVLVGEQRQMNDNLRQLLAQQLRH